jgi:hypothetical protein
VANAFDINEDQLIAGIEAHTDSKRRLILNSAQDRIFGNVLVGQRVSKIWEGIKYTGVVTEFKPSKKKNEVDLYHISYDDGDVEDINQEEVEEIVVATLV